MIRNDLRADYPLQATMRAVLFERFSTVVRVRMSILGRLIGFGRDEVYDEAMAAFDRGDFERSITFLERCIEERSDSDTVRLARFHLADSHVELGRRKYRTGQSASALAHLEIALGRFPNYADVNLLTSKTSFSLGDMERTHFYLQRALKANSRMGDAIAFHGAVLFAAGRREEGLARVAEAFDCDLNWDRALFDSAVGAFERGHFARSLSILLTCGRDFVNAPHLFLCLGDTLAREKQGQAATVAYRKLLAMAPGHADVHFRIGRVFYDDGRFDEAAAEFEMAVKLDPQYEDAIAFLESVCARRQGRSAA